MKIVDVQVATSLTMDGLPTSYTPLKATDDPNPGPAVMAAIATTSVKVRFNRFLLPTDTFRQSICVQSNPTPVKAYKNCDGATAIYLEPSYDPIHREITFRQSADMSKLHMQLGVLYQVTLFPPDSNGLNGIAAFDGAPLEAVKSYSFTTSDSLPANAKLDALPTDGDKVFCDVVAPALSGCAYGGCHFYPGAGAPGAAEGLDLSSPASIGGTAVSHTAHGTQQGEHANKGDRTPLRFGRAMPLVDPNFPGNSYLLYKLLANPANTPVLDNGPDAAEVKRIRASVVVGMPMPPSNAQGAVLNPSKLDAISSWILQGAPTSAACQ